MKSVVLQNLCLRAEVWAQGAELRRLGTLTGMEFLWEGDPAMWGRTSPILFPVVGRCRNDQILVEGRPYPMPKHGFARDACFELLWASRESCTFGLTDHAETRAAYPFPFALRVTHRLEDWALHCFVEVENTGNAPLPFFLGAHPAFRWPLNPQAPKEAHRLHFERQEADELLGLDETGFLKREKTPSPAHHQTLELSERLFAHDALLFDHPASRAVCYEAPGYPLLQINWSGYRQLALWSKPDAPFLCIEPWLGLPSAVDEEGPFNRRRGIGVLAPGQTCVCRWSVTVLGA